MADTVAKDIKETFLDMGIILQLEGRKPRLMAQLRNLGIHCREYHLDTLLRRPEMSESLGNQLVKAVAAIIEYNGRKYPRRKLYPEKNRKKQFYTN